MNQFRRLVRHYSNWWKTWRSLPVFDWVRAADLYRAGRYESAEAFYRAGLADHLHHPARFSARLDLAYCLFKQRKLKDSEMELRMVATSSNLPREGYLRLARLQLWSGFPLEAAWTIKRALQRVEPDGEMVASFLLAVLENGGPDYLLNEAVAYLDKLTPFDREHKLLKVALAQLKLHCGDYEGGKAELATLCAKPNAPFEAFIPYVTILLREEGRIEECKHHLRRAMAVAPDYPRLLSLFAELYLVSGESYNAEFAVQLASAACQQTNWSSPREMHILAESYYHQHDRFAALIMANKAKSAGTKVLGAYKDSRSLDKLIESLSAEG